jgi:hypothetical protein
VLKLSSNVSDVFLKVLKLSCGVSECKPLAGGGGAGTGNAVPMVLACDGGAGDVIAAVRFAAFGVPAGVRSMCGMGLH